MEFGAIVTASLLVFGSLLILILVIRKALRAKGRYQFNITFMTPGVNPHVTVYSDKLEFKHKDKNGKEYSIKSDRLYRVRPRREARLWNKFRGIKKVFMIVFQHNKKTGIHPPKVKVSTRILKEVNESRALDRALKGEFKMPIDLKKILMVVGFIVIVTVAYVLVTGGVLTG